MAEVEETGEETLTEDEKVARIREISGGSDRPIPGESLTNDPESPAPFEGPPQFSQKEDALEYLFVLLTEEDTYENLLGMLMDDVPIMQIVKIILYRGFSDGLWNPDMMLILAEPLAYMIMALAERADVDFKIDEDDEEAAIRAQEPKQLNQMDTALQQVKPTTETELPESISKQIENVPVPPSLMAKP
jgi:hypothetical protein